MEAIKGPSRWKPIHKDNIVTRDKVSDWLYIFDEVNCTYFYLIVGEKKALLFDTGYAFTNIRPLVDEIVGDKPLYVVCSHGHDDHVLGCSQFPEAYFSFADWDLCMKNDNPEQLEKQILARRESAPDIDNLVNREEYYKTSFANTKFHDAKDGDVFDLGGITLKVYPVPGHTKGSIALYCPEKKAIFSGDVMTKGQPLIYGQSLAISSEPQEFIAALSRLKELDVEIVWPAHGDAPLDASIISKTRDMLIAFAHEGDLEKDAYLIPGPHIFGPKTDGPRTGYRFYYQDLAVNYNKGHLEQIHEFMAANNGAVE